MFTGIIEDFGFLKKKVKRSGILELEIETRVLHPGEGESIAVNGVCLTVTKVLKKGFVAEIVPETERRSNLAMAPFRAPLNLESSLKMGERLDGHMVYAHVDGLGRIKKIKKTGDSGELSLILPKKLLRFAVEKGSISINGVSLTIASMEKDTVTVALIPFTWKNTNLGLLENNDLVNIEVDMLARYLYKMLRQLRNL